MKVLIPILIGLLVVGCGKEEWPEYKTCERCKEADIKDLRLMPKKY